MIHTHHTAALAVACKDDGLAMDNYGRIAYHDFEGVTVHTTSSSGCSHA